MPIIDDIILFNLIIKIIIIIQIIKKKNNKYNFIITKIMEFDYL